MISVGNAAGICDECQAEHDVHPGFRRFGYPPRRRISLQCQLGNLNWQDFRLLDHQLASLHYPGALEGGPARGRPWIVFLAALHAMGFELLARSARSGPWPA
jgi:hypothetical protein